MINVFCDLYIVGNTMIRSCSLFLFFFWVSSCSPNFISPNLSAKRNCEPDGSFTPSSATINRLGQVIFATDRQEFYFGLVEENWQCEKIKSQVINKFSGASAQVLKASLPKQDNSQTEILETRMNFDSNNEFRSFVSSQCASEGLSYLFEVSAPTGQKVYGCQINPQISSAVMWRKTDQSSSVDIAYLPFYQPFVERFSQSN